MLISFRPSTFDTTKTLIAVYLNRFHYHRLFCSVVILVAVIGAIVETAQKKKFPSIFSPPFVLEPELPLKHDEDADDEPLLDTQNGNAIYGEATTVYIPPPSKSRPKDFPI